MTVQLDLSKKIAPATMGPVLSPKIIKTVAKKLQVKHQEPADRRVTLALYLQGVVLSQDALKQSIRSITFPLSVVVADLRDDNENEGDVVLAEAARQCLTVFNEVSQVKVTGIHIGLGALCVLVGPDTPVDKVCAELKKAARAAGRDINIGICEGVASAKELPSAFRAACGISVLGERLWGKPYVYRKEDLGLVGALLDEGDVRQQAQCEAEQILSQLARPKNLLPTLKLLFAHNMSPTEVARAGKMHRNTVIYRLDKIKNQTGLDPLDFDDATQLYLALSLIELSQLSDLECHLRPNASVVDRVVLSLFSGNSAKEDREVRRVMSSMGIELPPDFTMVLHGASDTLPDDVRDTRLYAIHLGEDRVFAIHAVQPKRAVRLADSLCKQGLVAYLGSREAKDKLSLALPVLMHNYQLGSIKWPARRVLPEGIVGGLLALRGDSRLKQFAVARARVVVGEIRANKQLERTVIALLDSSLNLTLAANRLKVHRNTLIYRVGRIRHATGYDLTRFEDALQIRLALLLA